MSGVATRRPIRDRVTHRSSSSVGSQAGSPSGPVPVASSPAAYAVSTSSAATASSTCSRTAVALRSRTPRPPLRSTPGGRVPQWSSSSSTRRTASNAAPAATLSTREASREEVGTSGARSTGSVVVRPPRSTRPTSPGSTTEPPPRGTSSRRASSSSGGEQGAGRRRDLGEPLGDLLGRRGLRGAGPQPAYAGVEPADQQVGHARQRPQPGGGLPHQRQVAQVRECRVGGGRVRVHQRPQLLRCGLAGDDQGIKDGELDPRQLVERTHERSTGGGPRGQLPRVLRGGSGQIRTREEQARQLLVRPRAQLVGQ